MAAYAIELTTPRYASVPAHDYFSPALRAEYFIKNDGVSRALLGVPGIWVQAFYEHVNARGLIDKTPLYSASRLRKAIASNPGAAAAAAAAGSSAASKVSTPPTGRAASRSLSALDMLCLALFRMHTAATLKVCAFLFAVSVMTASRIFTTIIILLDKFFFFEFPPMSFAQALARTPQSVLNKLGVRVPVFAADCLECRRDQPSYGALAAKAFSRYKGFPTNKFLVIVHTGGTFTWCSEPYPGSFTDNEIIIAEWRNIERVIPRGSILLFDKGLLLTLEIVKLFTGGGIRPMVPSRKTKGSRHSEAHLVHSSRRTSNLRIIVENWIARVSQIFPFVRALHSSVETDILGPAMRVAFHICNYFAPLTSANTVSMKKKVPVPKKRAMRAKAKSAAVAASAAAASGSAASSTVSASTASASAAPTRAAAVLPSHVSDSNEDSDSDNSDSDDSFSSASTAFSSVDADASESLE
jgi:hypothetical protein